MKIRDIRGKKKYNPKKSEIAVVKNLNKKNRQKNLVVDVRLGGHVVIECFEFWKREFLY